MFSCKVCRSEYLSISGLHKHFRTKHKDAVVERKTAKRNIYFCNSCDQSFDLKKNLIHHVKVHTKSNKHHHIICSFENCSGTFFSMNELTLHIRSIHNVNIESTLLNFNTMEGLLFFIVLNILKCFSQLCRIVFFAHYVLYNHIFLDNNLKFFSFKCMIDFYEWKKNVEEKEMSQYIKITSNKKKGDKEYIYYFCHRSFDPKISNKVRFI